MRSAGTVVRCSALLESRGRGRSGDPFETRPELERSRQRLRAICRSRESRFSSTNRASMRVAGFALPKDSSRPLDRARSGPRYRAYGGSASERGSTRAPAARVASLASSDRPRADPMAGRITAPEERDSGECICGTRRIGARALGETRSSASSAARRMASRAAAHQSGAIRSAPQAIAWIGDAEEMLLGRCASDERGGERVANAKASESDARTASAPSAASGAREVGSPTRLAV